MFRYIAQGFGWAIGRKAAESALEKVAELGESELADAEKALAEEQARRANAGKQAEEARAARKQAREEREARAADELERLKRERGQS